MQKPPCVTTGRPRWKTPLPIGEQRFLTLGMDAAGRLLVVCHTQRDERTRIISARNASPNEVKNYHA